MEAFLKNSNWLRLLLLITVSVLITVVPILGSEDTSDAMQHDDENDIPSIKPFSKSLDFSEEDEECCVREKKLKKVGIAVSGEELLIDVGHCRKRCPAKKPLKKKTFEKLILENPSIDPRQLFLLHASHLQKRKPSCPSGESCIENDYRIERVMTSEGELTVDIVESCSCLISEKACKRHPKIVTFHKGSPLEAVVDVGECRGHCIQDNKCKPIVMKTTSVQGPNGAECVSVVEDCLCATDCYRISHYQQVYDYSHDTPLVKVIDIGKCVGECSNERRVHCILRKEENDSCLMSLKESASECLPISLKYNNFVDKFGVLNNISTIASCGCH